MNQTEYSNVTADTRSHKLYRVKGEQKKRLELTGGERKG